MAIGAQNAFVLRQGLRREHVGAVVLTCALSDAVLIAAGVAAFGLGAMIASGAFFTALGFGARLLGPVSALPAAWVVLELGVGCTMWAIAVALLVGS